MPLTYRRITRIIGGIGQGCEEQSTLEGSEGSTVDARHAPEEAPAACLGETLDPSPDTSPVDSRYSTASSLVRKGELG